MSRAWNYAIAVAACLTGATPAFAMVQDRTLVVPSTEVLLKNGCVRVQYHDAAAGETIPMHSHPAYVVYVLKPFKARIRLADGTERISVHRAGEAYWNEPITHSVENIGTGPIHNLIVEIKRGPPCK